MESGVIFPAVLFVSFVLLRSVWVGGPGGGPTSETSDPRGGGPGGRLYKSSSSLSILGISVNGTPWLMLVVLWWTSGIGAFLALGFE